MAGLDDVLDGVLRGELVVKDKDLVKVVGFDVREGVDLLGFANLEPDSLLLL